MTYEAPLDREICLMGFLCIQWRYYKWEEESKIENISKRKKEWKK